LKVSVLGGASKVPLTNMGIVVSSKGYDETVESLAQEYRELGYSVQCRPMPSELPEFLTTARRVDLIARRADCNIVYFVRTEVEHNLDQDLGRVAQLVSIQPFWNCRFMFCEVVTQELREDLLPFRWTAEELERIWLRLSSSPEPLCDELDIAEVLLLVESLLGDLDPTLRQESAAERLQKALTQGLLSETQCDVFQRALGKQPLRWQEVLPALELLFQRFILIMQGDTSPMKSLPPGNLAVPQERTLKWKKDSTLAETVLSWWAYRPLATWTKERKGDVPRALLARLVTNRQVSEANQFLLEHKPWGVSGTSSPVNPLGDYDFDLSVLTTILWLFGGDETRLYPKTREHLLRVLLIEDGNAYRDKAPNTGGRYPETENHLLMTEGSRYLKNRWLATHGNTDPRYDNLANGMEGKILALLSHLRTEGLWEFNSQPYIGYTLLGLLNLEAFGSEPVRTASRGVLDFLNFCYALGSYKLRHFPPFRRRDEYAKATQLSLGYQTTYMNVWLSFAPKNTIKATDSLSETHAIIAACLPYRPAEGVVTLLSDKGKGYFVRLGHGEGTCPEIYSAGPNYLLSAGGSRPSPASYVVPRPITLLLDDGATEISQTFHLAGPGSDYKLWNNTGVHENFAVASGPVSVPTTYKLLSESGNWRLFDGGKGLHIAVYSTPTLGILVLGSKLTLDQVRRANPDETTLARAFTFPDGRALTYDLACPKNQWVLVSEMGKPLDRAFETWPLLYAEHFS